jgi:hypothetical protein
MNILDIVEAWIQSLRSIFESAGVVVYFDRTRDSRPKASAVLNLRSGSIEADLVVWESGEADLSTMEHDGSTKQEHFENLQSLERLAPVLGRIAKLMKLSAGSA